VGVTVGCSVRVLMFLFSCSYRAPIASLDCMEEFQSTNEHLTQGAPQTKEQLLQSLSQQTPLTASNHGPLVSRQSSVTPGLRYRNLGKSGLRVSNVGLGKCPCPSVRPSVRPSFQTLRNRNYGNDIDEIWYSGDISHIVEST